MYFEDCEAIIKGSGERFDKLVMVTSDPYQDPIITKELNKYGDSTYSGADPHWLPGLFAVFCNDTHKAFDLVKKHDSRAFIDGSYMDGDSLHICFRAADKSEEFWKDLASACGFIFVESYTTCKEDDVDDYDDDDE